MKKPTPGITETVFAKIHGKLDGISNRLKLEYERLSSKPVYDNLKGLIPAKIAVIRIFIFTAKSGRFVFKGLRNFIACHARGRRIDIQKGDVIIMLDASWQQEFHKIIGKAKARGNTIVGVIYDLIPITKPYGKR